MGKKEEKFNYRALNFSMVTHLHDIAAIGREAPSRPALKRDIAKAGPPEWIPAIMLDYGKRFNGYELEWVLKTNDEVGGAIGLLPLAAIYSDWQGIVYAGTAFEDQSLPRFRPVDMRSNDVAVGLLHDERAAPQLYLLTFLETPHPLHLDIQGYFALLTQTLGLVYWTSLVAELAQQPAPVATTYQPEGNEARLFAAQLPLLPAALDLPAFITLYNRMRLP